MSVFHYELQNNRSFGKEFKKNIRYIFGCNSSTETSNRRYWERKIIETLYLKINQANPLLGNIFKKKFCKIFNIPLKIELWKVSFPLCSSPNSFTTPLMLISCARHILTFKITK